MDEWELVHRKVLISNATDLILRAFKLWAEDDGVDYSLENEELARREKGEIWMDEEWRYVKGTHPYTEEQLRKYLSTVKK
jgi:hypothetical protein